MSQLYKFSSSNSSGGSLIQQVRTSSALISNTNSILVNSGSTPQRTSGIEIFNISITPTSSNSILVVQCTATFGIQAVGNTCGAGLCLFSNLSLNAIAIASVVGILTDVSVSAFEPQSGGTAIGYVTAGTTSQIIFSARYGIFNGGGYSGGIALLGSINAGTAISHTLTVTEYSS